MVRNFARGAWLALATLIAASALQPFASAQNDGDDEVPRLFPLAPRELRQPLSRAAEAIEEQQYSDAVRELASVLNNPTADDYFLASQAGAEVQTSLRTAAQQMLGSMPAKGRDLYELQSGAEARAALDEALSAGDVQRLGDVARRYFHTKAGYEATLLLGKHHLDHGRPLAAALTMQRVAEYPVAARQYDPELSVLLAGAWNLAGMGEKAKQVLVDLKSRQPGAKISLGGNKSIPLFADDGEAIAWLEKLVGEGGLGRKLLASEWTMFRGNETRNASTTGSLPVLNYRWTVPVLNDPQDEQRAKLIAKQRIDRDDATIPTLQPLAVKDYVVARTPDRLLGIDLKTGKRIWVSWWEDNSTGKSTQQPQQPNANPAAQQRENELRQRLWEDGLFGQLSSDGEQVYVVDDLPLAPVTNPGIPRGVWFGNPRAMGVSAQSNNRLRALDLRSQGKLKWVVGGANGEDEPALAGAFFVGVPLPIAGQLYTMAEFNGELRLLCLNAKTGALEWKQQLATVEDANQIRIDPLRRLASASPSFADGVLVCPTSAGGVVAVDLATRSLRWGYQYPRWDLPQRFGGGFAQPNRGLQASATWLDSTVTIVCGRVILTPPESKTLHCLDLLTGEPVWQPMDRGDNLYVGCVHKEKVVLVAKDEVRAIGLNDGKPAMASISLEGESPTGRGYYSDKYYYLPVTGNQLLKIDLDEGKVVSRAKTEIPLGNLICYRDEMISVSPYWIASFYLSDPLRERVEAALKADPDDTWALCSKAELLVQESRHEEALALLRRAQKLRPEEDRPRSLLVKTVLVLLRDDFGKHRELVDEIEPLIDHPLQRRELLALRARGLQEAGLLWESFVAYQQLGRELAEAMSSTVETGDQLETMERDLRVRPDRWMMARLAAVFSAASEDVQQRMTEAIQADFKETEERGSASAYRQFVDRYSFHPLADRARLTLANQLLSANQLLEAEILASSLRKASDRSMAGQATALVAAIYEKADRPELAALAYEALGRDFAEVACRGSSTGKQLAEEAAAKKELAGHTPPRRWPGGKVEQKVNDSDANTRFVTFQSNFPINLSQWEGIPAFSLKATFDVQQYSLMVRDSLGRPMTTASLRTSEGGYRRFYPVQNNGLGGKALGHLVMVHLGPEIVAVDALQSQRPAGEVVLWRQEMMLGDVRSQQNFYPQSRQITNPILGSRLVQYDSTGQVNFSTGPLLESGLCFQRGRQLMCIDPLTGQLVWERSPVDSSSELFGDGELLFVSHADKDEVLVLSALDGTELGKRRAPKAEQRLTTHGRNVLSWSEKRRGVSYELVLADIWQPDKPLWTKVVPLGSRGAIVDAEEFALLEPSGLLTVISLATGNERFTAQLEPEKNLTQLSVLRSSDRYLIAAHQPMNEASSQIVNPVNSSVGSTPLVHGRLYSLNYSGEKQWQVPAFITQQYLLRDQPAESPLLFFLRNTRGSTDARWTTQMLVLDKRTGGIVAEGDLAPNQTQSAEVTGDASQSSMTLKVWFSPGFKSVTFKLTDEPAPPQPPAQTGAMSSMSIGEARGTVTNVAGAIFRALNRRATGPQPLDPLDDLFEAEPARPLPAPARPAGKAAEADNEDPFR